MFEKEIKAIYRLNVDKIVNLGAFCTFEQLETADLHPAILQYLSAEIEFLIYEDRQKLLKDSVFDYSSENLINHFKVMDNEIKSKKRFSIEYVKKLILHAASFNVNFLIRPKWSLLRIIFEEETRKSTDEIIQILNYVYYYDYLKKILTSYLKKKNITSINVHDFEEILEKIDQLEVESYLETIYDRALNSMKEFFNTGGHTAGRIPLKAVEIFLDEKHLTQELENLRKLPGSGNQYYDPDDLKMIIKGKFNSFDASQMNKKKDDVVEETPKFQLTPPEFDDTGADTSNQPDRLSNDDNEIKRQSLDSKLKKYSFTFKEDENEEEEEIINDPNQLTMADQLIDSVNEVESSQDRKEIDSDDEKEEDEIIVELDETENIIPNDSNDIKIEIPGEVAEEDDLNISFDEEIEELEKEIETFNNDESEHSQSKEESRLNDDPLLEKESKIKSEEEPELQPERNPEIYSISQTEKSNEDTPKENKPELSDFLESKNISKIIETVFDGDMEFFIHTSDLIAKVKSKSEAFEILERVFKSNYVNPSSRDAQNFKTIISEYFDSI